MMPVNVKYYSIESNDKDPKFKFNDHVLQNIKMRKFFCKRLHSKLI